MPDLHSDSPRAVLTLSTTFPNPAQPVLGLFVRARALPVSLRTNVCVVAPVSLFNGMSLSPAAFSVPFRRKEAGLTIYHPRWINLPGGSPLNAILLAGSVLSFVLLGRRRNRIHLIDAHFGYIDGVAAAIVAAVLQVPFIITLRGSELLHARYRFRRLAMAWAFRRASRILAVSANLREFACLLGVQPERITESPNGVDSEVFRPTREGVPASHFGVRSTSKVVVSVGNLIGLKGHHRVIAAIARLAGAGVDVELAIAGAESSGDPGYLETLRSSVRALRLEGRVHFLGTLSRTRVADLLCFADVLCLASDREGCPNVVREALACGTPVVATCVGSVPDLLQGDKFGIVVPVNDQAALEAGLAAALSRDWDRSEIANWGASRSWEQVADGVIQQFELALASH